MKIIDDMIGAGHSAVIKKVEYNNEQFALKVYKTTLDEKVKNKEIRALTMFKHPNILKMITADPDGCWILTELMDRDLYDYLKSDSNNAFSLQTANYCLKQIATGLSYLHQSGLVHRDIKLENILVGHNLELKICDFNFAEDVSKTKVNRLCGTQGYIAPELFQKSQIEIENLKPADIFSLGVLYFILVLKRPPFQDSKQCQLWKLVAKGDWKTFWYLHCKHNNNSVNIDDDFMELIQMMLHPHPPKRATITQVLEHRSICSVSDVVYLKEMGKSRHLIHN